MFDLQFNAFITITEFTSAYIVLTKVLQKSVSGSEHTATLPRDYNIKYNKV